MRVHEEGSEHEDANSLGGSGNQAKCKCERETLEFRKGSVGRTDVVQGRMALIEP